MRKSFKLDEIDCANCAQKLEDAIRKLDGVNDARVNFLTLTADDADFEGVLNRVIDLTAQIEPDCEIIR